MLKFYSIFIVKILLEIKGRNKQILKIKQIDNLTKKEK